MLEDESGRIRLVGDRLKDARLVTGVIIGALGMETPNGDFEVVDICCAEMAPQPSALERSNSAGDEMDVDGMWLERSTKNIFYRETQIKRLLLRVTSGLA